MTPLELFMTALPAQGVTLDRTPDGKASLRGLPVLRPGTWNGRTYTAADLQAMADNYASIREADAWEPPLRPRHMLDGAGNPVSLDARETLAWHKGLTWDAAAQVLKADLDVVDADTVAALESGKLRYVSAEVVRSGYTSPVTGKQYETPVYYGAAFVDNPAVKGMPWRLVVNAQEVQQVAETRVECLSWQGLSADEVRNKLSEALRPASQGDSMAVEFWVDELYEEYAIVRDGAASYRVAYTIGPDQSVTTGDRMPVRQQWVAVEQSAAAPAHTGRTPAEPKDGDRQMTWLETLKSVLRKDGAADEDLALIDQLADAAPAPPDAPTPTPAPGLDDATRAQISQLQQALTEQTALIEQLRETRQAETATATVDTLVRDGIVPPALRVQCLALVTALSGSSVTVEVLAADAETGTRSVGLLELFQELLCGMAPRIRSQSPYMLTGAPEQLSQVPPPSEAELDKIAAMAGGTPKGGN